jgi:uncharacterized protein YcbK (DUF882 family)
MTDNLPGAVTRRRFLGTVLAAAGTVVGPRAQPDAVAASPPGRLALYNTHTRETLEATFRDAAGRYDPRALAAIDHVLRCHYSGLATRIDLAVLDFLSVVDGRLGGDHEIHVISGFRSAEYNAWLIRHGRGVARRSLHLVGKAIDVRFPGVPLAAVRDAARALGLGGVGYYPGSDFVHLDSGPPRSW